MSAAANAPGLSDLVVEARAGSLALATGRPATSERGQLDMAAWKRIVASVVGTDPQVPLRLVFCGGANLISGYRLFYMLQAAKRAGVRRLVLCTDGAFWIDEATDWLAESGVDEIDLVVPDGLLSAILAARMRDVTARASVGTPVPRVSARTASPDVVPPSAHVIDWHSAAAID